MSKASKGKKIFSRKDWPKWLVITTNITFGVFLSCCIISGILSCIFIQTEVVGESMQPTINSHFVYGGINEDKVLINKLDKGARGDIIVVAKEDNSTPIVKRLLALGGDKIGFRVDGGYTYTYLIPNGSLEPIMLEKKPEGEMSSTYSHFKALKTNPNNTFIRIGDGEKSVDYLCVPKGKVFYLGDNRLNSKDCSEYGPVSSELIVGKVVLIIPYNKVAFFEKTKFYITSFFKWFVGK